MNHISMNDHIDHQLDKLQSAKRAAERTVRVNDLYGIECNTGEYVPVQWVEKGKYWAYFWKHDKGSYFIKFPTYEEAETEIYHRTVEALNISGFFSWLETFCAWTH